ncbi:hypothetical protein DENSPDRAFT_781509 [Dentipellis sp. KUC8613]|nr:hypothetical protein DENSPDRAFT_781509 [Dentipellis sp. KUC8613]
MPDIRQTTLVFTFLTILLGTLYSIRHNTYLDTSNPLLTARPHHLHATHYFASKANPLNVVFIKRAWAWTSAVFLFHILTSPTHSRRLQRTLQYILATCAWLGFTTWFFGPALLERVIASSGGQCVLHLPSGAYVPVPSEYCFNKTRVSALSHEQLFPTPLLVEGGWAAVPRLRRGHDVSGHVFLLTLGTLFLADQLAASFRRAQAWTPAHRIAVGLTGALMTLWMFANWITSVYFHSPMEKLSGFLLGIASYAITRLPFWLSDLARNDYPVPAS